MTSGDRLSIGLRHLKTGIIGVLLVAVATIVGVSLSASTSAFIRAYTRQTKVLLNSPAYREIRVYVPQLGSAVLDTPVVETEVKGTGFGSFSMDDMTAAAAASPAVQRAYIAERYQIPTTAFLMSTGRGSGKEEAAAGKSPTGEGAAAAESEVIYDIPVNALPAIRTTPDYFKAYGMTASQGSLFTQDDLDAGNWVIVLGHELARTLLPDGDAVGKRISLLYQTVTVLGVLEPTGLRDAKDGTPYDEMAFIPEQALQQAWGKRFLITDMRFSVGDSSDVHAAVNQLTTYFAGAHPDTDVVVEDATEELRQQRVTLRRVIAVLVFLSAVGLFIAAINLLNLMLIRVIKHTKSIGIMRALGTTERETFLLFATESMMMCAAGAIAGGLASPFVFRLLEGTIVSGQLPATGTYGLDLVIGAAIGFLVTAAFGLYPAYVARSTNTTLALRAE